jgi:prepilin-type N-terminal cleavage/methylation domain-containing protein
MNSMKANNQKGFTLIEVLIVVVMSLIVILAVGAVLVAGNKFWNKAWKMAELQRDAYYAMLRLSHPIKEGTNAEVQNDTDVKIYGRDGGWIRFFLVPGTNELQCEIPGQNLQTINGNVENVQFSIIDNNTVTIDLNLEKDNLLIHIASTVMMRNYGLSGVLR